MKMVSDENNMRIQVFPLVKDKINITTGTIANCKLVACVADGIIHLNEYDVDVTLTIGDTYGFDIQSVTVSTGTFHLA